MSRHSIFLLQGMGIRWKLYVHVEIEYMYIGIQYMKHTWGTTTHSDCLMSSNRITHPGLWVLAEASSIDQPRAGIICSIIFTYTLYAHDVCTHKRTYVIVVISERPFSQRTHILQRTYISIYIYIADIFCRHSFCCKISFG